MRMESDHASEGDKIYSICSYCEGRTRHKVLKAIDIRWPEDDSSDEISVSGWTEYQIIQCMSCEMISFREHGWNDNLLSHDRDTHIYPKLRDPFEKDPLIDTHLLPENLGKLYNELLEAFNQGQHLLCAMGLRSVIEGICVDKNVKSGTVTLFKKNGTIQPKKVKKNLMGKIEGLAEKNIITHDTAHTLHQHRFLGNAAVHELDVPPKKELLQAIEIVEYILIEIYELQQKHEELKKSIEAREAQKEVSKKKNVLIDVTAAILIKDGRFLIAKRKASAWLGDKWEFAGGKVEDGETPEECLRRELKEEFDIDVTVGAFVAESVYHYEHISIKLLAYRARLNGGTIKLRAHDDYAWVTPDEIDSFDFAPADQPFVDKIRRREIEF